MLTTNCAVAIPMTFITFPNQKKVFLEIPDNEGVSPFFAACWRGHLAVAKKLHGAGASKEGSNAKGHTAHDVAAEWGHVKIVEWLDTL